MPDYRIYLNGEGAAKFANPNTPQPSPEDENQVISGRSIITTGLVLGAGKQAAGIVTSNIKTITNSETEQRNVNDALTVGIYAGIVAFPSPATLAYLAIDTSAKAISTIQDVNNQRLQTEYVTDRIGKLTRNSRRGRL